MTCTGPGSGDSLHQDTEPCAVCGCCTSDSDSYVGCCTCVKEKTSSKWRDSTHWRAIRATQYQGSCDLCRHYHYRALALRFKRRRNHATEAAWEAKRLTHMVKKHTTNVAESGIHQARNRKGHKEQEPIL